MSDNKDNTNTDDPGKTEKDGRLLLMKEAGKKALGLTLSYLEAIEEIATDPAALPFTTLSEEMPTIIKVSKHYSEQVLLAEGKPTSNIGLDGKGGLPFKFVINKHYASPPPDGDDDTVDDEQEGTTSFSE